MDPSLMMLSGVSPYNSMMNNDFMMAPFLNNYQNQVSALDSINSLNMSADLLSMNGSIFPSFTGGTIDYDQFYKDMQRNQDYMCDNQLRMAERWRSNTFMANSPLIDIKDKVEALRTKVLEDEQEQIKNALEALKISVRNAYDPEGKASEAQILSQARDEYKKYTGKDLVEDIKNNSSGSFKQGFLQSITLGLYDGVTAEENVSRITGQPVGRKQEGLKTLGNSAGGAVIGASSLAVISKIGWLGKLLKSKPLWGALIGAVAGALGASAVSRSHS